MGHLVGVGSAHDNPADVLSALPGLSAVAPRHRRTDAARHYVGVLAIFASADIPLVIMAIRLHNVRTQHPGPVLETGGLAPVFCPPFLIGILALLLLGSAMMLVRLHQETSRREIDSLRRELHAI